MSWFCVSTKSPLLGSHEELYQVYTHIELGYFFFFALFPFLVAPGIQFWCQYSPKACVLLLLNSSGQGLPGH